MEDDLVMQDNVTSPNPVTAVVAGLGSYLPPRTVQNSDIENRLRKPDGWVRKMTGIEERHIADPGMATGDLAAEAGRRALKSSGSDHVDMVVLATLTPDLLLPGTAATVASRLGLQYAGACDMNAACSGFIYGLATATGLISTRVADRVLVIGAETLSTVTNRDDPSTAMIFADGAGAVVLRAGHPDEPGALKGFDLGSDGALDDLIRIPDGGSLQISRNEPLSPGGGCISMQGRKVFEQAVMHMRDSSTKTLDRIGWAVEDVDLFVGHQANVRILRALGESLGIPAERIYANIAKVGNTSAASIPLALSDAAQQSVLSPGNRVLMSAFGAGLSWGSVAMSWPDITVVD